MADAPFDPSGAVTFDLSSGRVNLEHAAARVLAPADGLRQLCEAAGEDATRAFGRAIGSCMGDRLAKRIAESEMKGVSLERFLDQLRGEFALAGLGVVGIERWGSGMVFVVEHATLPPRLVAAVLDGALEASTGRKTSCVKLMESEAQTRFLVANEATSEKVAKWVADGTAWGEVLVELHASAAKSGGDA